MSKITVIAFEFNHWANDGIAGINGEFLEKMDAMNRPKQLETISRPYN